MILAVALAACSAAVLPGCHAARVLAPPPAFRAASASDFAVDVEFAEPLDRTSAEIASHYRVYPVGHPETPVAILSATVIDTVAGRVVQLRLSGGPLVDGDSYQVSADAVRPFYGGAPMARTTTFHAGLGYASDIRALMAVHCDRCHNAALPGGRYRTDSYAALKGMGSDGNKANLIESDPASLIVKRSRPLRTMYDLGAMSYLDFEILYSWIVNYAARP